MKTKQLVGIAIAMALVMTLLTAQSAVSQFRVPIFVRDNANDSTNLLTKRDTVYFGVHPQGSACADPGAFYFAPCDSVIETLLPPAPPGGVFDARFVDEFADNSCLDQGVKFDIRDLAGPADVDTFMLAFKPGAGKYPMILRWPKGLGLLVDSMRLKSVNGTTINVNMLTLDSLRVTSGATTRLMVYLYRPKSQSVPPVPAMSLPADNATAVDTPVTFSWSSSAGATFYVLQISTSPTFATIVRRDTVASPSQIVRTLGYNQRYYWRVSANTSFLNGCFQSTPFTMTTVCTAPVLSTPAANANVSARPTLTWGASVIAVRYELQLASDSNFSNVILSNTTLTTNSLQVGPLPTCLAYYWRVRTVCATETTPYSTKRRFTVAVPDVPVQSFPAANAANTDTAVTLLWAIPDSCSRSYRVQVTKDTINLTPANLILNDSIQTASRRAGGLAMGTDYFWRVRAAGAGGVGPYSGFRKFRTNIYPPVLIAPAAGDTMVPINVILRWFTALKADSFQVQVATDTGFSLIAYSGAFTADTFATVGPLSNCGQYYWHVRGRNAGGPGTFSSARSFRVVSAPPAAPTLSAPANGQDSVDGQPTLGWTPGDACSISYRLEVGLDASLSTTIVDVTIPGTTRVIGPLESNTVYYWRVTPNGSGGPGAPSAIFSFTTTPFTTPPPPALSSPANGQPNVSFPVIVCWDSSARATSYRLQVAIDSTFGTKIVDDSTLTLRCRQLAGLLNAKTYFWRVSAKNSVGGSVFSAFRRFTTLSAPQPPILISPANGEEGVNAVAQFLWSIPETAESYRFQLSRDSSFSSLVKDDSTIQVTSTQAGPLESHRKYFWRVRGKNSAGAGAYSPVASFRTDYVGVSNWRMPLTVRENGNAEETIYFGLHPDATSGIDPALDEFELPPPDFFGTFDVRFVGPPLRPASIGEGLRLNLMEFRNYTQVDTYRVRFQPGFGGYPISFSWSAGYARIVCDSMVLVDEFGGNTVRRRMDVDSSVSVTNSSLSTLLIIKYGAHPILDVPASGHEQEVPKGFALSQNYPNPFNPTTSIRFSTEEVADIDIVVYDVLGRMISRLASRSYYPGQYSVVWDGTNEQGMVMPSGMYYVRMTAMERPSGAAEPMRFSATRKMVMLK